MKMFSFKILASVSLLLGSLCPSEHGGAPLRSGVAVADNGVLARGGTSLRRASTSTLKDPRVLNKKKKQKVPKAAKPPKGGKKAKSAVTPQPSSQSSSQPTATVSPSSQPSSQTTEACAAITTQKDALLALKEGFTNGDTALASWVTTTDPCTDEWTGITCDSDGKVTSIDLCK